MKKILTGIIILLSITACNNNELEKLKAENAHLKSEIEQLKETDDFHYKSGVDYLSQSNWSQAKAEFLTVINKYPQSKLLADANKGLAKAEATLLAEEKARKATALKAQREQDRAERLRGTPIAYATFFAKAEGGGLPVGKRYRFTACLRRNPFGVADEPPSCLGHLLGPTGKDFDSNETLENFLAASGNSAVGEITASMGSDGYVHIHRFND